MSAETIIIIVQMVAAFGVVVSVIYLGIQIHQQNEITKAQFGHSLTHRMYERYFNTSKDKEFSNFLSKDWAAGELDNADKWRVAVYVNALLVDIFDTYEKVEKGFVDETHLKMRMHMLKLGTMKAPIAQSTWKYWRGIKSKEFVEWFETEIYGDRATFKEGYQEEIIPNVRRD
ncbi:MAG: hypothetical protein CM15mP16_07760 [Candidatus Pelagibacterales bacterium]|jgi:hypothetical protein|nr:MAG: hypothetical protein CM15mP16_07760 [Pelagibacterales bacterium]|tara:strand:- start:228 stop:746 length:519 start_codon:yes stop_codon:yes gene_type:complete